MQDIGRCRKTRVGIITFLGCDFPLADPHISVLRQQIEQCLNDGELKIVLDLKKVPYMDSLGLEELINLDEMTKRKGGVLRIANPNPVCKDIFIATRLANRFETFTDLEMAGKSLL